MDFGNSILTPQGINLLANSAGGLGAALGKLVEQNQQQNFQNEIINAPNTAEAYNNLTAKYPEYSKQIQDAQKLKKDNMVESDFVDGARIFGAISTGDPKRIDFSKKFLDSKISASKSAGIDTSRLEQIRESLDEDPNNAASAIGFVLSSINPDKFDKLYKNYTSINKAPLEERKLKAETVKAEEEAALTPEKIRADIDAKQKEKLPASLMEAIGFQNLTEEQQKIFKNIQALKGQKTEIKLDIDKEGSKVFAQQIPDFYEKAQSSKDLLSNIVNYKKSLSSAITGPLAKQRLSAARLASVLGFSGDQAAVSTTEAIKGLAELTLQSRQMLKGQGAITIEEQKLLERARSGDIEMTKSELQRIFDISEKAANIQYKKNAKFLSEAAKRSDVGKMYNDVLSSEVAPDNKSGSSQQVRTFTRPANFSDAQWDAYKKSQGL